MFFYQYIIQQQNNISEKEFVDLINKNIGLIKKVCRIYYKTTQDAEDLFQEIVLQLWTSYKSFKGDSKFSTWMYRVAINTAISIIRKQQKSIDFKELKNGVNFICTENFTGSENEQLTLIYQAIETLNDIDKAIVLLYLEGFSYEEMEQIVGLQQNNLRVKMNRIKDKLRKQTQAMNHES